MRILIDTHILIWYLNGDENLAPHLRQIIEDPNNTPVISTVSLWEIAIKIGAKRLSLDISLSLIQNYINEKDIELLNIKFDSLIVLSDLPYHHKDPFDRFLIAQAIAENISIISLDRYFSSYSVNVIY